MQPDAMDSDTFDLRCRAQTTETGPQSDALAPPVDSVCGLSLITRPDLPPPPLERRLQHSISHSQVTRLRPDQLSSVAIVRVDCSGVWTGSWGSLTGPHQLVVRHQFDSRKRMPVECRSKTRRIFPGQGRPRDS